MYVRALIVVLAILNAGVALWWAMRPAASPSPPPAIAAGVASLQLMAAPAATAVPAAPPTEPARPVEADARPVPPPAPVASVAAPAERCLSFGPYPDQAAAEAARGAAGALLQSPRLREVAEATSFRVMLMGVGDKAAAQSVVARIKAAGLNDYYIVGNAGQNDIALGQYRSREGAERRQNELATAGFAAQVLSNGGEGGSRWWIDARSRADNAALRTLHASTQRTLDCAALR